VYDDLQSVLPVNSANKYIDSTRDVREILRRGYWVANDPDPTTEVNERQLEHIYRVFLSDLLFTNDWTGRRGWRSDRGETFIKYGAPLKIEHSMGAAWTATARRGRTTVTASSASFSSWTNSLNGDPRIPYDDDYVLHNMLHDGEISQLRSTTERISGPARCCRVPG
jgi:GWxTD domain-containing protein